jgi:hypothetical protein
VKSLLKAINVCVNNKGREGREKGERKNERGMSNFNSFSWIAGWFIQHPQAKEIWLEVDHDSALVYAWSVVVRCICFDFYSTDSDVCRLLSLSILIDRVVWFLGRNC